MHQININYEKIYFKNLIQNKYFNLLEYYFLMETPSKLQNSTI